jgi:hypothetical protein
MRDYIVKIDGAENETWLCGYINYRFVYLGFTSDFRKQMRSPCCNATCLKYVDTLNDQALFISKAEVIFVRLIVPCCDSCSKGN